MLCSHDTCQIHSSFCRLVNPTSWILLRVVVSVMQVCQADGFVHVQQTRVQDAEWLWDRRAALLSNHWDASRCDRWGNRLPLGTVGQQVRMVMMVLKGITLVGVIWSFEVIVICLLEDTSTLFLVLILFCMFFVLSDGCSFLRSKPDILTALFTLTRDPSTAVVKQCYHIFVNLSADEAAHQVMGLRTLPHWCNVI